MRTTWNLLRFSSALIGLNMRGTIALRGAFALQAAFMLLNNAVFFTMWIIFFDRFEELGGWKLEDVGTVFGVVALSFGLAYVVGAGAAQLARLIIAGDLDAVLTQPKPALLQLVTSRTSAAAWGDMATGIVFLAIVQRTDLPGAALLVLMVVCSAFGFMASIVILNCLAFWLGRVEHLAAMLGEFTLTFSLYPRPLFGGPVRLLLFTVIPAGLVGWLPVEAVRDPAPAPIIATIAASAGLVLLAFVVFGLGVRRYESGNRFGAAG